MLDFMTPEKGKKDKTTNIKQNNNSGLPVKLLNPI